MKAVLLLSGGLDSALAGKIIKEMGIDVYGFNLTTPFCNCTSKNSSEHQAILSAREIGIPVKILSVKQEYLDIIKEPKYGWGKGVNPCIDCRIFLIRKAKDYMENIKAKFIITGEVLGQRPKSQHLKALKIIEKETGLEGLILRPLSAKLLPETVIEKKGWVDRKKLFNISGRSRKTQFELANIFGLKEYGCPAGGCLLTDIEFSKKVKEAISHNEFNFENIKFLKVGRHFRLENGSHLVLGRNERECNFLLNNSNSNTKIELKEVKGSAGIFLTENEKDYYTASGIVLRYSKATEEGEVIIRRKDRDIILRGEKFSDDFVRRLRI